MLYDREYRFRKQVPALLVRALPVHTPETCVIKEGAEDTTRPLHTPETCVAKEGVNAPAPI